jgi:hypothetical protein
MAFGGTARGLSVFVNIGANLLPSLNGTATKVEERFALMGRRMRVQAAEMKATWRSTMAAASPLLSLAAAGGLTMGIKGALGSGAEYQHQIVMMRVMGRTTREVADSIAAANATIRNVPTSTLIDSLKILNETTLAFGGLGHAMENLQFNSKMGALLKAQLGDEAGGPDAFNKMARLIELRGGKVDSATYQRLANSFFRAITVSGGKVTPDELLGFGQQALPGLRAYSEDYLGRVVPSLIQEFGGERAGTVSAALAQQFMGRVPVGGMRLVKKWQEYGLLKPGTGGTGGKGGRAGWNPDDVVGLDIGLTNPLQYFEQIMIPRLKAHGVNLNDPKQVMIAASQLFGRQTGARIASTFLDPKQLARIHADMGLYDKASGVDQAYGQALYNDPKMAGMAAAASLKNMETALGKGLMSPAFNKAIVTMANGFNRLAGVFDRHPAFAKGILALMGLGAVAATMKLFGIGIRFVLGPLRGLFALLFTVGPRGIGIVGWILRGLVKGFALIAPLLRGLGPLLLRGLAALAPMVMEGLGAAFALLSNPVGWAIILGAVAIALVVYFRGPLMRAWQRGWNALKNWVLSVNWGSIGMRIANALTFGLAGKFASALNNLKATAGPNVGMDAKHGGLTGMRAGGGPVRRGGAYLVGERGMEIFTPNRNGYIIPNHHVAAMTGGPRHARPGRAAVHIGELHVHGVREEVDVERAVHRAINRIANGQAALLSD